MSQVNLGSTVTFTDAAAGRVHTLLEEEGNPNLNLRVYVTGGGCAGFQYGFTFDEKINEDDIIIQKKIAVIAFTGNNSLVSDHSTEGEVIVKLLIDPISFQYLQNAEIDYREDVNGEQFVIRNPNAKTTCGCGSSFAA